jgi:hypothetical protein
LAAHIAGQSHQSDRYEAKPDDPDVFFSHGYFNDVRVNVIGIMVFRYYVQCSCEKVQLNPAFCLEIIPKTLSQKVRGIHREAYNFWITSHLFVLKALS